MRSLFISLIVILLSCHKDDCRVTSYDKDRELVISIVDSITGENILDQYAGSRLILVMLNEETLIPRSEKIYNISEGMESIVYRAQIGCNFPGTRFFDLLIPQEEPIRINMDFDRFLQGDNKKCEDFCYGKHISIIKAQNRIFNYEYNDGKEKLVELKI